jgi:galactokinase/mevalonate kinase-like predicted kinase
MALAILTAIGCTAETPAGQQMSSSKQYFWERNSISDAPGRSGLGVSSFKAVKVLAILDIIRHSRTGNCEQ